VVETRHLKDEGGALKHQVGDTLELFVIRADDQIVLAPSLRADPRAALSQVREARQAGVPISGKVVGLNAGGLEVDFGGARGFCPVSQIEAGYCANPSAYIGRTLDFLITEVDESRGRTVASRKALLKRENEERARALLASLKAGDELEGTITRLEPFGAFVDLGGVDGLVHVSEIRYERTGHPRDAVSEGQKVRVRVLRVEPGKQGKTRIGLSIKAAAPDPWASVADQFRKGQLVSGTVARLTDFGAFVTLAPGIDGLVHVSEVALHPLKHPREAVEQGQTVEAMVTAVDPERKRISLSIRQAQGGAGGGVEPGAAPAPGAPAPPPEPTAGEVVDGLVASIKPFGVFVDLPSYGRRARGLIPREETGQPRNADLARSFKVGSPVKVQVIAVKDGKIRLSVAGAKEREEQESYRKYREGPRPADAPLTTMAEALRKAMEKKRERER
jgi:small subunit ribosomal protein S1